MSNLFMLWCWFVWRQDWLAKDLPHSRILSVGYESYLNEWVTKCPYEKEK